MKGILFSEPMFNFVIEGRKTQTRRIVKPQPQGCFVPTKDGYQDGHYHNFDHRYEVGETVYIKEPYSFGLEDETVYKYSSLEIKGYKWENKLFMPAKYARYFIEITGVRCERVNEITSEDCLKEGICLVNDPIGMKCYHWDKNSNYAYANPREAYAALFDSINGKGIWESNPYVWVYSFKNPELLTEK